ncbi:phytoene/squalene synthase family protein [Mesorhizobium loti]|uniref:Phytoene/squalene synthase family protein n=1 Tax=Mesorhizobium loti R88b TaxID=935548 RepID=A0A6M7WTB5_RHILI|nr:phytoene/squalene synthase family protein [Mesorhizobium loti]QKD05307.1 phytoene/squalene synthase family protein [Mesorhizobium loti R88b]
MLQHLQLEPFATPANCAACRTSIRQGSQSFYIASLLLPVEIREPAYAVYAFCRMADDLIDREAGGTAAIHELGWMLDRIYGGRPGPHFVERGFADVVSAFAIPRAVPEALIEGMAWDAAGKRYDTLDDLTAYAVRVAGTVGFMMTLVMDRRDPQVLARACDLGVAMQLTNIARDIGEDAGNGRLYMPVSWLRETGIDPEAWMASPRYLPEIRSVVDRLLVEADRLYLRSLSGIAALPGSCRVGINVARLLYRGIGRQIANGVNPVTSRAVTTWPQKLRLVGEAIASPVADRTGLAEPAVAQATFLIDAVAAMPAPRRAPTLPPWWDVKSRSIRMIQLLDGFSARAAAVETANRNRPLLIRHESKFESGK